MNHTQGPMATTVEPSAKAAALALLKRIHFYIGLFVGPFIFIAALTGVLYVATPQIENKIYAEQLFTSSRGDVQPLSRQIDAARAVMGEQARIYAIRPAPSEGETTRVQFSRSGLGASESRAVFIDPVTLDVKGDLTVYGTSGVLPFRTWLDNLHRGLLLGDIGRNYSELAASWLWVAALGGILLWAFTRTGHKSARSISKQGAQQRRGRLWHTSLGLILLVGLLFFSATGLTWSQWAGNNIGILRADMGWLTPAVSTQLGEDKEPQPADEHAEHHASSMSDMDMSEMKMPDMPDSVMSGMHHSPVSSSIQVDAVTFDGVVAAARHAGIHAAKIEIRPAYQAEKAWTVSEIDRSWPTRVDAVSVDPATLRIVDHVYFAQFPLLAKLTRWGVDAHMGVLFGAANQLLLIFFGLGTCALIGWGYLLWWQRRPKMAGQRSPAATLIQTWRALPILMRWSFLALVVALAFSLPVMGVSLLLFLLVDLLRWLHQSRTREARQITSAAK
ncbi:PepSY-associated TM helix domain-containing protein [Rouxiella chamberiensis]|uniref:PepSY-associated TM helix domain-containing protein n=1 Tax=Rouxiella chamberiensis TaxID=1513468 RepID=A0ABY7HQ98_9GAMM|nr:PepSY-associated TM helix domain-containing protein [Rouxiella chamberiensis]WAT01563.1 PepSY-associated TM helix domain-containing protein [Rouxiella chamberiensis]